MSYPTLSLGAVGSYVTQLQKALNLGLGLQPKLPLDGSFGPMTQGRVMEFQRQKGLVPNGVVSEATWLALANLLASTGGGQGTPGGGTPDARAAKEALYRNRIVEEAYFALASWGWNGQVEPGPFLPRIAAARCADPSNPLRPRQGGASLAAIFTLAGAGVGKIALCPSIRLDIELLYQAPDGSPGRRDTLNQQDIGSWCGIFAFYIYKKAGLNLGPWTSYSELMRKPWESVTPSKQLDYVPPDGVVRAGDIGVLPTIANHHFIVVEDPGGGGIKSIDGNIANPLTGQISPWNSVIGERATHSRTEVKNATGFFLRPIWENLLAGW